VEARATEITVAVRLLRSRSERPVVVLVDLPSVLIAVAVEGRWLYVATALSCLAPAAASIYEYFQARRRKPEKMALKLPTRLRKLVNRVVRGGAGVRATAPVAFVTGAGVSLIELACTGQVYLPTIIFVLGVPAMLVRAFAYLLLYNVVFILPPVAAFVLAYFGTTSHQMGVFVYRRTGLIKLVTVVLFVVLA
jgi:hypothetical protein